MDEHQTRDDETDELTDDAQTAADETSDAVPAYLKRSFDGADHLSDERKSKRFKDETGLCETATAQPTMTQVNGDVKVQLHAAANTDAADTPAHPAPQRRSLRLCKQHNDEPALPLSVVASAPADVSSPVCSSAVYRLQSIVQHRGAVAYSGHYVTDVRNNDEWSRYDDQYVKPITQDAALRRAQSEGYIFAFTALDVHNKNDATR